MTLPTPTRFLGARSVRVTVGHLALLPMVLLLAACPASAPLQGSPPLSKNPFVSTKYAAPSRAITALTVLVPRTVGFRPNAQSSTIQAESLAAINAYVRSFNVALPASVRKEILGSALPGAVATFEPGQHDARLPADAHPFQLIVNPYAIKHQYNGARMDVEVTLFDAAANVRVWYAVAEVPLERHIAPETAANDFAGLVRGDLQRGGLLP